jgi:hypothetical protein
MSGRGKIPEEITDAFGEALVLLVQWQGGSDEPVVSLDGKSFRISALFELVAGRKFTERMPASMVRLLLTYASKDSARQPQYDQLTIHPTYAVGARCLLKWAIDKK